MRLFRREPHLASAEDAYLTALDALDDDPEMTVRLLHRILKSDDYEDAAVWRAQAAALTVEARFDLDEVRAANQALDELPAPHTSDDWYATGRALYRGGRFEQAVAAFVEAVAADSSHAEAWYHLGRSQLWTGETIPAATAFERAHSLDEAMPATVQVSRDKFEDIALNAFASIPEPLAAMVTNSNLMVTAPYLPPRDEVEEDGLDPDVLGYFAGHLDDSEGGLQRICLFQANIECVVSTPEDLIEQVGITVLHEVAHFFGLEHEDIDETRAR